MSRIYKKLKLSKDDREEVSIANKRRLQYDQDGRGEERFLETILLMLREVKNCSSASKQVVGSAMHNAFRISLGKFLLLYFCLFLVCIFVEVLHVAYLILILNWFCSENLPSDFQRFRSQLEKVKCRGEEKKSAVFARQRRAQETCWEPQF